MNALELDQTLRKYTPSENLYLENPNHLSEKYSRIKEITIGETSLYVFEFNSILQTTKIAISKDSRFTTVPMHIHSVLELNYIYSGECTQIINNHEVKLYAGDVCLLDTNVPHSILRTGENDIIINIVMKKAYMSTGFLSRLSNQGILSNFLIDAVSKNRDHNRYIVFRSSKSEKFPRLMTELLCEYYDKQLCHNEIIDSYMVIIFSELLRVFQQDNAQEFSNSSRNAHLIDILQYLEQNYHSCTLVSTASHFKFHPNYIGAFLKKKTGKSFKELLLMQRMTQASIFLINSTVPIYEIANEVGYENLGFFYKKFRDFFGETPQKYRERYQIDK